MGIKLKSILARSRISSTETAKERLQTVLAHDRAGIPPAILALLKEALIAAISRHVDIQREAVEIKLSQGDGESHLIATIPLKPINARQKR